MMAAREAGYTMEQYRNDPKIIADTFIRAVEKYQYDGITVDIDTVTLAGACGVSVDFPNDEPARSHEGLLDSLMDVEQLKPLRIQTYKYVDIWCEAVHLLKQHFQQEIFIRGNCDQAPFSLATMLRGTENLMLDLCPGTCFCFTGLLSGSDDSVRFSHERSWSRYDFQWR